MAPELYDELYDEKVDIYAFGMSVRIGSSSSSSRSSSAVTPQLKSFSNSSSAVTLPL